MIPNQIAQPYYWVFRNYPHIRIYSDDFEFMVYGCQYVPNGSMVFAINTILLLGQFLMASEDILFLTIKGSFGVGLS